MDASQVMFVVVAGVWGSFGVTLQAFRVINERRDIIYHGQHGRLTLTVAQRVRMYYSDLIPIHVAVGVFMFVMMFVFLSLPDFSPAADQDALRRICRLAALVPGSSMLGYAAFGIFDVASVGQFLVGEQNKAEEQNLAQVIEQVVRTTVAAELEEYGLLDDNVLPKPTNGDPKLGDSKGAEQ